MESQNTSSSSGHAFPLPAGWLWAQQQWPPPYILGVQKTPSPQAPVLTPASCPLSALGSSFPAGMLPQGSRQGRSSHVTHACGTGTTICALLGGRLWKCLKGDSVLRPGWGLLSPSQSEEQRWQCRVRSTQEEEFFQSYGSKGTGKASTTQAPGISSCLGQGNQAEESGGMRWDGAVICRGKGPLPWVHWFCLEKQPSSSTPSAL